MLSRRPFDMCPVAARAALSAAAVGCLVVMSSGCAPVATRVESPGKSPAWECRPLEPGHEELWAGTPGVWSSERGDMVSVHRTTSKDEAGTLAASEGEAVAEAAAAAAGAALDLLEARGVRYSEERKKEIVADAAEAVAAGEEITFPRLKIASKSVEECTSPENRETAWRAALLVRYPLGLLRGDAVNVQWERSRALREVRVLAQSAADHFAEGRWLEGLRDRARALDVVERTGALTTPSGLEGYAPFEQELADALGEPALSDRSVVDIALTPRGEVDVLESGAAAGNIVEFACSYRWAGREVSAVGVPVRFAMEGAGAVLDAEPATDGTGTARCTIVAAYGPTGPYQLTAEVDRGVLAESGLADPRVVGPSPGGAASSRVYLVEGAHALSVCARFECGDASDDAQLIHGLTRRLERDGYTVRECGPDVDAILSGTVSMFTRDDAGGAGEGAVWTTEVTVSASAFDQRVAARIGETVVTVTESSDRGRRETEVLALKEAGRLVAVYFAGRILAVAD
jgi:hypothetical protein